MQALDSAQLLGRLSPTEDNNRESHTASQDSVTPPVSNTPAFLSNRPSSSPERSRSLRKPSPGLLARMKLLDSANKARVVSSPVLGQDKIGRIPESQLRELDDLHRQQYSTLIERRGRAWSSNTSSPLLVPQRTGDSAALSTMDAEPLPEVDSEHSSIISTSDRVVASDSELSEDHRDTKQKYRLPELEKTISPSVITSETITERSADPSQPPTPPPKDTPIIPDSPAAQWQSTADGGTDLETYLRNRGNSRANSIYTLSRVSFTNQISQLTSIKLPDATSLAASIKAKSSSQQAGRALGEAATQIQSWIRKASEVLEGLGAEDDIDWAAAAGKDGLADVDAAIVIFEDLIKVYVGAIEELQGREDIASLAAQDLKFLVDQMEEVVGKWANIKKTLNGVKEQVEIAMEWEELWNTVLGEIGQELEALHRLVFEMEERRHRIALAEADPDNLDFGELETIVEEAPRNNARAAARNRFSFTPAFGSDSPLLSPTSESKQEDSRLLALTARMQPLRASLDFLPMRLAAFDNRASAIFPSACGELQARKDVLENTWQKLEADAEALRGELGEDRWIHIFRSAGAKAMSMWTSLTRSTRKLRKAFEDGADFEYIQLKLVSYEEKKQHYPPAIERVLGVIDKGISDRLTINGEILRMQADIRQKMTALYAEVKEMDQFLEDTRLDHGIGALRDSISTNMSSAQSVGSSINFGTPGSSPASSVIMSSGVSPQLGSKSRQTSFASSASKAPAFSTPNKRQSSIPTLGSSGTLPRKTPVSRSSAVDSRGGASSPSPNRYGATTPSNRRVSAPSTSEYRPRWNSSVNMKDTVVGHNFKPMSATTPSPHRKVSTPTPPRVLRSVSSQSSIPVPSPLSRSSFALPSPTTVARPASTTPAQQAAARAMHSAGRSDASRRPSLGPHNSSPVTPRRPPSSLHTKASRSSLAIPTASSSGRRSSAMNHLEADDTSPTERKSVRPPSALAGRRSSMLPTPTSTRTMSGTASGRMSRAGDDADRPRWRP